MLSRVGEAIYWLARYIERGEDVARLLDVEFHALLDSPDALLEDTWRDLIRATGKEELFHEHFEGLTSAAVAEFLLWHPANPDAVVTCVERARENARSVREQISSEMWERINRLYLAVRAADPQATIAVPHTFFVTLRDASHALQGTVEATLTRGEAYRFLRLGASLERADMTARVVCVKAGHLELGADTEPRLGALLRSCGAFEAFRRHPGARFDHDSVTAFLVLEESFPRSVRACLSSARDTVTTIAERGDPPTRMLTRLLAELELFELSPHGGTALRELLERVVAGIAAAGEEIGHAFFTTHTIASAPMAQAAQQQQ